MIRSFRRLIRDRRGISAVEFAILSPVMMMMLMGFFDLAQQAYIRSVLQGAM
jgi:Flp pilus assembly protein TadG